MAWLLYWGGAVCRTHLSGVTGDYDWVAACRAPEVIQSGALISTMTIVPPPPTPPPPPTTTTTPPKPPQLFSWPLAPRCPRSVCSSLLLRRYTFTFPKPNTLHQMTHTFCKSSSDMCMCFFWCCTQLARKVSTFSQCVTLWVKSFELVIQTACLNRAAKKQVFILLLLSLFIKKAIKINSPNETIMVFGITS